MTRIEDDPVAAARELAAEIANRSPDAIRRVKLLANQVPKLTVAEGLALEERLQTRAARQRRTRRPRPGRP